MGNRLDYLFQEWHQLGGAVLLAEKSNDVLVRSSEKVIAESTNYCRKSGRLTWIVLDWLIHNIEQIDEQKLLQETKKIGELSILGLLCDAAFLQKQHSKFEHIIIACEPHKEIEPFFHRVAKSPLALRLTKEKPLDIFLKWNYLCNELRYL